MKLYRGLKTKKFNLLEEKIELRNKDIWKRILKLRSKGNFKYPHQLNNEIIKLYKESKLAYQHFTDHKDISLRYAKENNGLLIEINPPISDILKNFNIEVQNYNKRKDRFELVYMIESNLLNKHKEDWDFNLIEV